MLTAQTHNFVKPHISHPYKHPHLGELCAQTSTSTHFARVIEEMNRQQRLKMNALNTNIQDLSYDPHKHPNLS